MGKGSREGGTIGLPLHVAESLVEAPLRVVGAPAGTAAAHRRRSALPGSGNRAHAQAQGIGRLSSFAHALHARPQSIAEIHGVAARAIAAAAPVRLPPGCPAVRSILLLSKRFCHRSSCGGAEGNWGSLRMQLNAPCQESSHRSNESVLPALRFSRS